MARYRQKDEHDLAWNKIRRRITRDVDTQFADIREEVLNRLLSSAWTDYVAALERGEKPLEIEAQETAFVRSILTDVIDIQVESPLAAA